MLNYSCIPSMEFFLQQIDTAPVISHVTLDLPHPMASFPILLEQRIKNALHSHEMNDNMYFIDVLGSYYPCHSTITKILDHLNTLQNFLLDKYL